MRIGRRGRWRTLVCAAAAVLTAAACDQFTAGPAVGASGVTAVAITPSAVQVAVGQTTQLTAVITGDTSQGVTWSSANTAIATVDNTGLVLGVATGVTTVSAVSVSDTTRKASATVTVVAGTADRVPLR